MEACSEKGSSCSECDSVDVIIKKARKSYCRNCWKYRLEFQFRKRLFEFGRPAKGTVGQVFRPAEQVLISYDGSPSSVALINLAANALVFGMNQPNEGGASSKIPFPFKFVILVILESELNGSPGVVGRQKQHLQSLLRWTRYATKASGGIPYPLLATCLEMSLEEYVDCKDGTTEGDKLFVANLSDSEPLESSQQTTPSDNVQHIARIDIQDLKLPFNDVLDNQLAELRTSMKSKTEDKELVNILKRNLVNTVAERLSINKILLPEDQTSLAVKMFSMMSHGRGCQVANEMAFSASTNNGILVARPLVDVSDIDLRAYLQTLSDECTDGIVSKGSAKRKMKIDSVERQCDDFITNLQQGYPATVSTLTRIGSKLQPTSYDNSDVVPNADLTPPSNQCRFCKRQSEEGALCYGCQQFLNDAHPEKLGHFKNLLRLC